MKSSMGTFKFGPFHLDPSARDLWREDQIRNRQLIKLRPKEFDLLLILVENAPALVTIDELLDKVWGEIRTEGTVTTTLSRLRAKLETDGEVYIETVAKNGFRSTKPVTREMAPAKPVSRLPKRLSLFIGRGREIAELER